MGADEYRVVFDVTQTAPAWWFPAFGLVFVVAASLQLRFRRPTSRWRVVSNIGVLVFAVLWTIGTGVGVFGQHFRAQRQLESGEATVVEGVVEDFHPMPHSGHDTERFVVDGVHFAYSDYRVSEGFNNTSSHGGPMRPGLRVRIHYSGKKEQAVILKLEIKDDGVR